MEIVMNCVFCGAEALSDHQIKILESDFADLFSTQLSAKAPLFTCNLSNLKVLADTINSILWAYRNESLNLIARQASVCKGSVLVSLISICGENKNLCGDNKTYDVVAEEKWLQRLKIDMIGLLPVNREKPEELIRLKMNALFQEMEEYGVFTLREMLNACRLNILEFREILSEHFRADIKSCYFDLNKPMDSYLKSILVRSHDWLLYQENKYYFNVNYI